MKKPTFIIIGSARCATTSLHAYLEEHPQINLSQIKEINFFSNARFFNRGFEWYLSHFSSLHGDAVGEASTSYTAAIGDDDTTPRRIAAYLESIRLIYIVRDPIDRLLSHYLHYQHRGERFAPPSDLLRSKTFLDTRWQGCYYHQLSLYRRYFSKEQLLVITMDALRSDREQTLQRIFAHIGVEPFFVIANNSVRRLHNSSENSTKKSAWGRWLLSIYGRRLEHTRIPSFGKSLWRRAAEIGASRITTPVLSKAEYETLFDMYKEDSANLQREYDVDTSGWFR